MAAGSYCFELAGGECFFVCPTGTGHVGFVTIGAQGDANGRFALTPDEADDLADEIKRFAELCRARRPAARSVRKTS